MRTNSIHFLTHAHTHTRTLPPLRVNSVTHDRARRCSGPLTVSAAFQPDLFKTGVTNPAPGAPALVQNLAALVQNLGADVGAELHLCIMWMRVAVSFNVLATPAPAALSFLMSAGL
jgi:hypothetical protein